MANYLLNGLVLNLYGKRSVENSDQLSILIKTEPEKALHEMYRHYFSSMCNVVFAILKDRVTAEDIVQEVFIEVWKKQSELEIQTSIGAYLKKACRNRTLNHIRNNKVKWEEDTVLTDYLDTNTTAEQQLQAEDLDRSIQHMISDLPEKCGIVFSLSRYEEMSYAAISKELNISIKTVENQISKALKILRKKILQEDDNE